MTWSSLDLDFGFLAGSSASWTPCLLHSFQRGRLGEMLLETLCVSLILTGSLARYRISGGALALRILKGPLSNSTACLAGADKPWLFHTLFLGLLEARGTLTFHALITHTNLVSMRAFCSKLGILVCSARFLRYLFNDFLGSIFFVLFGNSNKQAVKDPNILLLFCHLSFCFFF